MLDAFLERMAATPFVDGRTDCALTVADWVMEATDCPDPASDIRGRYRTALGRERLLKRLGGLEAVMTACATRSGLRETKEPRRGDVGLVEFGGRQFAAICLGRHWAIQSRAGLFGTEAAILKAWEVARG